MNSSNSNLSETTAPLKPLTIEIGGPGSGAYKSIDHIVWENIPPFAVLTGVNGSGKTQLLELLAYRLTETENPNFDKVRVVVTGDTLGPDSIAYLPNDWHLANPVMSISEMQNAKANLYGQLRPENSRGDLNRKTLRARLERLLGVPLSKLDHATFADRLPDDFGFMLDEANVTVGLAHVFLAYRLRRAGELERGTLVEAIPEKLGPAPWDVVNQIFEAAEFPYRVTSPLDRGLLEPYQLRLESPYASEPLWPTDLSSGEIRLLGLVLWLYNSQHHGRFPRLLLLDEPDAHLHPSMTRHFINVLKEVLVDRYNVRVILSTHSPSTVALAPNGSVFEMSRTKPRIVPSKSKADSIGLLTAGLVIVSPSSRLVLVEDEDDVDFYDAIRDVLSDYGPSKDLRALLPSPSLIFLPASTGKGKDKVSGGKGVVFSWIDKLNQPPLNEIIRGIVDRDSGNVATTRIHVLHRYSIENYLLDPFVVFGVLLDQGIAPFTVGSVSRGDEHRLRTLERAELQLVVNGIAEKIEPLLPGLTTHEVVRQEVSFTNGRSVEYPGWMIDRRGHDLLRVYQDVFAGPGVISPPRLYRSLRRVRLIPTELADIMEKLQH